MSLTKSGGYTTAAQLRTVNGSNNIKMSGTPLFSQLSTAAVASATGAFSLRSVNGGTAKAVAVQAHPVVQWPPVPMTSNTTVVSGQLYGNGTYVTKSSNGYINMATSTTQAEFRAFDYTTSSYWEENYILGGSYSVNTGDLLYPTQYETTVSGATAQGNWLQIQLPSAMTLRNYTIVPRSTFEYRSPSTFWIAGSTDGTTWSNVHFQSGIIRYANPNGRSFTVPTTSNSVPYSYYRLIVNKTVPSSGGGQTILNIVSLNLFGDSTSYAPNAAQDFYADRLGNMLTAPVTGQTLEGWLGGATGYVTTWYDQSGQGNHATQAIAANQPVLNLLNASISFNGNQWLSNATTTGMFIPLFQNAYSVVTKHRQWAAGAAWSTGNTASFASFSFNGLRWATGNYYQNYRGGGFLQFGPQPGTYPVVATVVNDRTNDIGYINGTQSATTTGITPNVEAIYSQFIGYDANSGTNRLQGELQSVLFFKSAVSTADRTLLETLI